MLKKIIKKYKNKNKENQFRNDKNKCIKSSDDEIRRCAYIVKPSTWIIILSIAFFLVGLLIWGSLGKVKIKINTSLYSNNHYATIYVKPDKIERIKINNDVYINDNLIFKIDDIDQKPIVVDQNNIPYSAQKIAGINEGDIIYCVYAKSQNLNNGCFACDIVTNTVSLFESIYYGFLN